MLEKVRHRHYRSAFYSGKIANLVTQYADFTAICNASTVLPLHGMIRRINWETTRVDSPSTGVCDRLIALVKQILGPGKVFPEPFPLTTQLSDLGVSSLKMVNLMLAVELEFDIAIPQSDITPENFQSCASIEALVEKTLQKKSAR